MGKINLKQENVSVKVGEAIQTVYLLKNSQLALFNPTVLGLGDLGQKSCRVEAIAAIFDLSGFTKFCSQIDPQLSVPDYLSGFLKWLFDKIKTETVHESYGPGKTLWCDLPFMAKFLGDGVLFLWDTQRMEGTGICNVVTSMDNICKVYGTEFYSKIKQVVIDPPYALRCGIARGSVYSVGSGEDYVGPCINIASRLQKLGSLTFCVDRKGFDLAKDGGTEVDEFYLKSILIRGIENKELVWVKRTEFDNLQAEEKQNFANP